ncbi:MAG TPA: BTAD domain-containing putative transcriptional regulator [Streptosporangiaceae bacterium]|nr:BTAD domain-containing putative transcriptional regulator [Streptosporangiaceae bacterium]
MTPDVTAGPEVRVSVFGTVTVTSSGGNAVGGRALGGRRVRLALVALALSAGPVPAERLAAIIWPEQQPPTWPAALRGVIRSLRTSLAPVGGGGDRVVLTTPLGYGLAPGVQVDLHEAAATLRTAGGLADQGRHEAAVQAAEPLTLLSSDQLLPGEDGSWLEPYRAQADAVALQALELMARSAGALGDHHLAAEAGRRAVAANPLDERSHRILIRALQRGGDRAGVVLAYEACRAVLADQLGVDPAPETVQVYLAAIGAGEAVGSARLPQQATAFFGRETEVTALADAIGEPGLVTVAGRGGVGKSRLALQVALAVGPSEFAGGGRSWVSLASVPQDELVASTVAMELGLPVGTDDPATLVAGHFAPLGRALLVLDGCEAVVDGTASLADSLLASCPMLTLLVTSRIPLAVEAETVIAVDPLAVPGQMTWPPSQLAAELAASTQVRLLADRVRAGGGQLVVDDTTVPFVAELCRRCGGLPLALELVAAQLAAMSVPDLLDHLPELVAGGQDWLRGVATSSYALLDTDEATVFRRFGVLDGQVTLPLVREVVADEVIPAVRIVRILRELTARGLLAVDRSGSRWRYHQEDDLHRLARELLESAGESGPMLGRLASVVLATIPADPSAAPEPFLEAIGEVLPQIRSLLAAAIDGRLAAGTGIELAFRLHRYWAATNVAEGRFWLSRLLASLLASPVSASPVSASPASASPVSAGPGGWELAHAAYALGYLSYWSGDTASAVRELELSAQLLEGRSDQYAARALTYLGGLADDMDRGDEALDFVRRAIKATRPFGVDLQVGAAIGMGCVLAERADVRAAEYATEAIELCRRAGTPQQLAATLPTAAMVCWQVGELTLARQYVAEAMPLLGDSRRIARIVMLSVAAGIALADLDLDAAIDFAEVANSEATDLGIERELPLIRCLLARALLDRGDDRAAAARALDAVLAARSLTYPYPMATCLETAALVCLHGAGQAGRADRSGDSGEDLAGTSKTLLDAAARIRAAGHRPGPVTLSEATEAARIAVTAETGDQPGDNSGLSAAVDLAVRALSERPRATSR